jgi:hypothetical protein
MNVTGESQDSWYSPRILITIPTLLCIISCNSANYTPNAVLTHVSILAVLVVSKLRFMHGVRILGINKTVGVDDNGSSVGDGEGVRFKRE